jgi:hypothetical protein
VVEHPKLERGEIGPGVDAELVGEMVPNLVVRSQRIGLSPAPVERDHQQLPQPLPQRIALRRHAQIRRDLRVATRLQQGPEPVLANRCPYLTQPSRRTGHPALPRELLEDLTSPQGERLVEDGHRGGRIVADESMPVSREALEPEEVDIVALRAKQVPGRLADEDRRRCTGQTVRLEGASQVRDVRVERPGGPCRRFIAPHVVDQPLSRDHPVDLQHQQRQHRPLARRAEIDRGAVVAGRHERTEQAKAHAEV